MLIFIIIVTIMKIQIMANKKRLSMIIIIPINIIFIIIRPCFILRIVRPRIFESTFRNYCAKKLDGALRTSTSFV